MMAAAQPFLSGAISKTINMPEESTIEDISNAYIESWKLGLKAVAIYRDNSKRSQPLNARGGKSEEKKTETVDAAMEPIQRELFARMQREKMPVERASVTHKFSVGGHEGYITVGMYADGRAGRNLHEDVQGRLDAIGHDGRSGVDHFAGLAVWRATEGVRR